MANPNLTLQEHDKSDGARTAYWISVVFDSPDEWFPRFRDVARIVGAIAGCEEEKYKYVDGQPTKARGAEMVRDLLNEVINEAKHAGASVWLDDDVFDTIWARLRTKYRLPQ